MLPSLILLAIILPVAFAAPPDHSLLISTKSGSVQGFLDTNTTTTPLRKWYGIRFAQDTTGQNRWRPPKPTIPHLEEVFNATAFGPACMQGRPPATAGAGTSVQSEDCLRVNVIAPVGAKNLPVYLYSYGGGFDSGSPSDPKIDGSFLASRGIVFASYGYRLSLWGYPHALEIAQANQTQNFGLLDTRAAIEWLRDNIEAFGGDPNKITLGGESVGAEMTNQYISAFSKDPIIRAAVMQSADTNQPMWPLNSQLSAIAQNFSCPTGKGELDCLRKVSATDLQTVLLATGKQFQPVTDNITVFKDYVKQTRQRTVASVPLLIGTNKDEGTLIVQGDPTENNETAYITSNNLNLPWASPTALLKLYPVPSKEFPAALNATAGMWRDAHMLCLASNLARERTNVLKQPVWRYRFDLLADNLNSQGTSIGVFHGEDIRFVMGTTSLIGTSAPFIPATPFQKKVSDLMVTAWTNFIKDPHKGPSIPGWNKYDPTDPSTLAILGLSEDKADPGNHFEADRSCAYWNTILPIFPQTFPACGNWTC